MIEFLILLACAAGIREVAKRRGSNGWIFALGAVVGFFVFGSLSVALFGPGPNYLVSWGWVGVCYLSVFLLTGKGRRLESSWQCPECRFYNDPTTLLCPCGYRYPES
jgi:hypothetical protein